MPGAQVTLMPEDATMRLNFTRTDAASQSGMFRLGGVRPGTYRLLAWEDVAPMFAYDPGFFVRFAARASRVTIAEGAAVTVDLTPVSARDAERAAARR
jgi:hypothetical protein